MFDSEYSIDCTDKYLQNGFFVSSAMLTLAGWNGAVLDSAHRGQFSSVKFQLGNLDKLDFMSKELQYCMNAVKLTDCFKVETGDIDSVKEHIMQYGGGAVSMYYNSISFDDDRGIWSVQNDGEDPRDSHAVCVVGRDDNIPADDLTVFGYTPSSDGAFIVKNSWGTELGTDGYYYVPYETFMNYSNDSAYFFSFDSADSYTYNYGYDDLRDIYWRSGDDSSDSIAAANVYTASDDGETLEAVSFFPSGNEKEYEIRVYTDVPEGSDNPESGTLRAVEKGGRQESGYRTIRLSNPVSLNAGERFACVVKVTSENGEDCSFALNGPTSIETNDLDCAPKRGESYLYTDSEGWQDVCDLNINNTRIKALTHSDSAPALTEPDDYDSFGGASKAELNEKLNSIDARWLGMSSIKPNYDSNEVAALECYSELCYSIRAYPDLFNASELCATAVNYEKTLNNLSILDPISLLGEYKASAKAILEGDPLTVPVDIAYYKLFTELYDDIGEKARNLELNERLKWQMVSELRQNLFGMVHYMFEHTLDAHAYYGDIDNDGAITIMDVTKLQRMFAEMTGRDYYSKANADVNGDGVDTIEDATCIQRLLAEMTDHLPVYEESFGAEDGYDPCEIDRETAAEYLKSVLDGCALMWDGYVPDVDYAMSDYYKKICYDMAKAALQNADSISPAELLCNARRLDRALEQSFTPGK